MVSKIARSDCPKEWPELLPTLIQAIESNDSLVQHRGLLTLHNVIKAFSSKRLAGKLTVLTDLHFAFGEHKYFLCVEMKVIEDCFKNSLPISTHLF